MGAFSLRVPINGLYQYALQECMKENALFFVHERRSPRLA